MNLLQIGMGLHNYHDALKSFPPAFVPGEENEPKHSWRVLVLPYFTTDAFYDRYDMSEPWNSAGNLKLAAEHGQSKYYYRCPADPSLGKTTSYPAVVGAATAWPGSEPSHIRGFSKGTSHSIQLVEQTNSGIDWLEPRDLQFDRLELAIHSRSRMGFSSPRPSSGPTISSEHLGGANVLFADASVEFLAPDTSPQVLRDLLVIGGNEPGIPLGPRDRLRLEFDPNSTDRKSPLKLRSYTLDETREPNR
jgi:prepilin-type processing-associated H-X9-DG protein